jgi:N-methylhydantoinase A/oxoprolinase/acetone carboxylase beta subunit
VLEKSGCSLDDIENFCHGTTVIINALTERKGVRVGLITSKGFRDVLEVARGDRPNYFDLFYKKPPPFVPRYLRKELPERIDYKGNVVIPLDLGPLDEIVEEFKKEQVEAVAISFLHSYVNPSHEEAVAKAIKTLYPQLYVSPAHEIVREWREYERTNTAVLSAYVKPIANRYLDSSQDFADQAGLPRRHLRDAIELRYQYLRARARGSDYDGRIGPCKRSVGRGGNRQAARLPQRHRAGYRRHHRQVQPHQGWHGPHHF